MNPFAALARAVVRWRWVVLALWLVGVPLAASLLPTLASVTKNDNTSFLPAGAPSQRAEALAAPFFVKGKGSVVLVAARSGSPLTAADDAAVTRAESAVAALGFTLSVRDEGTSADGEARKAFVELDLPPFAAGSREEHAVDQLRAAVAGARAPAGLAVHVTGDLAINVDQQRAVNRSRGVTEQLATLFIIVLLFVVFRALLAPVVTLLPAALALVLAGPVIAEATHIGVKASDLLQLLLVVLVLGAGTDYGLFLIFRMREELRAGHDPKEAVTRSLTRVGESITFSAFTVIAALVSLLLASFGLYTGLGPGLAIGIACVLLANLTLLPALLAIIGRAAFWPLVPRPGQDRRSFWGVVAGRVVKHPVPTLLLGLAVFGGLALSMLDYSAGGFGSPTVKATSDSSRGAAVLASHFAAADSNPTSVLLRFAKPVWDDPSALTRADSVLGTSGMFSDVAGPLHPDGNVPGAAAGPPGAAQQRVDFAPAQLAELHQALGPPQLLAFAEAPAAISAGIPLTVYQAYRSEAQLVSADGLTVQYLTALRAGDPGTNAALHAVPAVELAAARAAQAAGARTYGVAGEAAALHDVATISGHDLVKVIPVVLLVLAALLAVVLRSLIAPLYLVLSVGLSYLASLGFAVLAFVVIGNQDGINFVLPFFMFIFIMALGEDYNILVMSRIREEAHDLRLRDAVRRAVQRTGTTVTSAGLILAGTFFVLTVAGGTQVKEIGVGLAVGVLLDTFFVRTLLVPSMVVLIGRWNWWPSRLFREEKGEDRTFSEEPDDQRSGALPAGTA